MAKVTAQVVGGQAQTFEGIDTVEQAKAKLGLDGNYSATVNGEPADMDEDLPDFAFVTFAKSVKGGY